MLIGSFSDLLPKSLAAAFVVWGAANYFVIGPNIASRIVRADHVPICEAGFKALAEKAGEERLKQLPLPDFDAGHDYALGQARRVLNSPAMQHLRQMSGGLAESFGLDIDGAARQALRRAEEAREAAKQAYELSLARIREETATKLASAGSVCGCIADAGIADTRTEWAVYSGTLSLFRPAPVANFSERMAQLQRAGECAGGKAGA